MSTCKPLYWLSAILILAVSLPLVAAPAPKLNGGDGAWGAHRAGVLTDASLIRYYTFDGIGDGFSVRNAAPGGGDLQFRAVPKEGAPNERPVIIAGRWPGKTAVRFDAGAYEGEPFEVPAKSFTVEAWLRKNGHGVISGDRSATNGTLLSVGIGYWDGWRITTTYPDLTLGFEIGRPQPSFAVSMFDVGPLADGVWNHVAATWDGKEMRLYLNGVLSRSRRFDGDYTPPKPGDRFRIGFAGYGWGSTRLDVDEVAVYGKARSPIQILRDSLRVAPGDRFAEQFVAATDAYNRRDFRGAASVYRSLLAAPLAQPDWGALVRLRLSACERSLGDAATAARELTALFVNRAASAQYRAAAAVELLRLNRTQAGSVSPDVLHKLLETPGISNRDRYLVRLNLARSQRQARRFAVAEKEYRTLMSDPSTPRAARPDLSLEMAHALRQAGDYAAARSAYSAIASATDARADLRDYAALLAAGCLVAERNWPGARAAYRALLASNDLPLSHRLEIEETLRSIDRLEAGRPARDPEESRRRIPSGPSSAVTLFVAPSGSDANAGDAEHPLATFQGAVRAVRAFKARGVVSSGGISVVFKGGEYRVTETVRFTAGDGGTAGSPIVYRAAPGETVRFTGGVRLRGFRAVTDPAILSRLPEAARGKVVQVDLRAEGVTDFGKLYPHGMNAAAHPVTELFFNGRALPLARWPNEGWATTGKVIEAKTADGGFAFEYAGNRPARWVNAKDAWLFGYWMWQWADSAVPIADIDPAAHRIRGGGGASYGIAPGMPYYAYNLLEELDAPGEWFLDRETGLLYLYPPSDPNAAAVELSVFAAPFVEMNGASYITFQHLGFELGRSDGLVVKSGDHCLFEGCTIRELGGTGVTIDGGSDDGIFGCDIYSLGRGGTWVKGGDRKTLTPSGHFVENCHIYDFSRWDRTYTPAVYTEGVGTHIAHNLIHDSPGHAMRLEGNDHVVEYNEVHHVVRETDDQGAVDIFYNLSYRGIVLRYNFWHHMGDGSDRLMHAGIRLDDAISGVTIYGNVFYKSSEGYFGGVQIHGGKDNIVENNLFVGCKYGVSFSQWGADRWKKFLAGQDIVDLTTKAVDISAPPFSTRYPALAHLAENIDVNRIWRNIACGCGEFLTRDNNKEDEFDNLVTVEDPGFASLSGGDFTIKESSSALGMTGFRPIPFREIGLYADPLRASPPIRQPFEDRF